MTDQGKTIAETVKAIAQAGGAEHAWPPNSRFHGGLPLTVPGLVTRSSTGRQIVMAPQPVSPIGIAARLGGLVAIG
ncbi:MAG: hypothetical protein JOZ35_15330 [Hyphomicrobiales bacterium]|nr:hypothetical protein [Hyphomicrobiales bacterium]